MNLNDLESQLQEHYSNEELPFEPTHWDEMQALLNDKMPTKKRRKFFLIWFFLLFGAFGTQHPQKLLDRSEETTLFDFGRLTTDSYLTRALSEKEPGQNADHSPSDKPSQLFSIAATEITSMQKSTPRNASAPTSNYALEQREYRQAQNLADEQPLASSGSQTTEATPLQKNVPRNDLTTSLQLGGIPLVESTLSGLSKVNPSLQVSLPENTEREVSPRAIWSDSLFKMCVDFSELEDSQHIDALTTVSEFALKPRKRSRFKVSVNGSMFMPRRSLGTSAELSTNFRREHEKSLFAYSYGISLQYAPVNRLYFSTGLSQLHLAEETLYPEVNLFSFTERTETEILKRKEITSIDTVSISLGNETKLIIDTHFVLHRDTFQYTVVDTSQHTYSVVNNRVHISYHEIPFSVGYSFSHKGWSLFVEPSIYLGFLSEVSGSYYVVENNEIQTLGREYFKSSTLSMGAQIGLERRIGQHWSVSATIRQRRNLGSISSNPFFNHRYVHTGSRLSLMYSF